MNTMSMARLQALEQAKSYYEAAISTLPQPENAIEIAADCERDSATLCLPLDAQQRISTLNNDIWTAAPAFPSPSLESNIWTDNGRILNPSPVRAIKAVKFNGSLLSPAPAPAPQHPLTPPSTPPLKSASSLSNTSSPILSASLDYTGLWLHNRIAERYNTDLEDFAAMLARHVEVVNDLITATRAAQELKYSTRKPSSYSHHDGQDAKAADLRVRISRLKDQGWKRERFDPRKYEQLCDDALAEL